MNTFTRYLDAWRFCVQHNLSIAAIEKTGYSKYTVFIDDKYLISAE